MTDRSGYERGDWTGVYGAWPRFPGHGRRRPAALPRVGVLDHRHVARVKRNSRWSPEGDATRRAVNEWIRTSEAYDAVIDFEAVVRDPATPTKVLAEYDSGDHLHPGDGGYEAMANAVDLALLQTTVPVLTVTR